MLKLSKKKAINYIIISLFKKKNYIIIGLPLLYYNDLPWQFTIKLINQSY